MKMISTRLVLFAFASLIWLLTAMPCQADGGDLCQVRAEYQNLSSQQTATQTRNPGVMFIMGHRGPLPGGSVTLQESSFGQPFSPWYPSDTFTSTTIASVRAALYPEVTPSTARSVIEGSDKPFRYKWLLYEGTGTDVTAFDPASIAQWFTDLDRSTIDAQIRVLKRAVAASPMDTRLWDLLLDVFNDLAVAEMQAAKPELAKLAKLHLGLEALTSGKFIIDEEIATSEKIVDAMQNALDQYAKLLHDPFPVDPGSFDFRAGVAGMPMGQYVFRKRQPVRNSMPSQYANADGIAEVPDVDATNNAVVRPPNQPLFTGYKDLNTLWQILGQSLQHQTTLTRLRGTRLAPGDLAKARETLTTAAGSAGTDLQIIRGWFPELFPPNLSTLTVADCQTLDHLLEASGIQLSLSAIETGRSDLASVAPFLNGSANLLGYDPDFLLLVQDQNGGTVPRESYDILREMMKGANHPLEDALIKLNGSGGTPVVQGARQLYQSFQEKVDRVATDIAEADLALEERFFDITFFDLGASPGFDFATLNAKPASDLWNAQQTIATLDGQANLREGLNRQFDDLLRDNVDKTKAGAAVAAVAQAEAKEKALLDAGQAYKDATRPMYQEMIGMSAAAAGSQAAYQTFADVAGTDAVTEFVTGGSVGIALAVAGAANTVIQTAAAAVTGVRERDIDYAGIDFQVTTQSVDAALMVNQARQELSSLKREQIGANMAALSDQAARAQAEALKAALVSELDYIVYKRNKLVSAIRKKSYADPLHYYRAESALITADESFRTAQRWMFYTLQALEYKWHGRFAITEGTRSWDKSSIFKARNANELDELLTQMENWNQIRVIQTTSSPVLLTRISLLEHVLARNPNRTSLSNSADPGTRMETTSDPPAAVSTLQYFRNRLSEHLDAGGNLIIPFSTAIGTEPADQIDGTFFVGPSYNADGTINAPGFWRDKISYVKVNVIAEDGPATPHSYSGSLTYGGTTYFRTRVPPCPNGSLAGLQPSDQSGEFMVTPFRWWVSPDFSQNFSSVSEQTVSIPIAYGQATGLIPGSGSDLLSDSYKINAFGGRSIAATGWRLRVNKTQGGGRVFDPARIKDIEIIVAYKHSDRVSPPICP